MQNNENVLPWWYIGYLVMGITAGLAFYVLYKEPNPVLVRRHLIMSIWPTPVVWVPVYIAIIAATVVLPGFDRSLV